MVSLHVSLHLSIFMFSLCSRFCAVWSTQFSHLNCLQRGANLDINLISFSLSWCYYNRTCQLEQRNGEEILDCFFFATCTNIINLIKLNFSLTWYNKTFCNIFFSYIGVLQFIYIMFNLIITFSFISLIVEANIFDLWSFLQVHSLFNLWSNILDSQKPPDFNLIFAQS